MGCFLDIFFNTTLHIVADKKDTIRLIIYELTLEDINNHKQDFLKRWDEYEKITFNEMVFKFWIPVKKFYENKDFLKKEY